MTHAEIAFLIIFIVIISVCMTYVARKRSGLKPTQPGAETAGVHRAEEDVARLNEPRRAGK